MADNYIEKKFEEHFASAKAKRKWVAATLHTRREGTIQVEFAPRRVLVAGGATGTGKAAVEAFRKAECRVALCDTEQNHGRSTAQATGSRFYPIKEFNAETLNSVCADIISQWGDIDVIIDAGTDTEQITAACMLQNREQQSESNRYGRIISITSADREITLESEMLKELSNYGITVNNIKADTDKGEKAAQMCIYLCIDDMKFIDRQNISL